MCAICLEAYGVRSAPEAAVMPCSHTFHRRCICRWLGQLEEGEYRCPLCRAPLDAAAAASGGGAAAHIHATQPAIDLLLA